MCTHKALQKLKEHVDLKRQCGYITMLNSHNRHRRRASDSAEWRGRSAGPRLSACPSEIGWQNQGPPVLSGDTHLGGGMDTNGSTESFELVTEDNNGEGKAKTDGENILFCPQSKIWKEKVLWFQGCHAAFFQLRHLKTSGFLWSCASACRSSALSSTAKCAGKSPRTNSAAVKGKQKAGEKAPGVFRKC